MANLYQLDSIKKVKKACLDYNWTENIPLISPDQFKENKIVWLVFAYLPNIAILDLC